MKFKLNADCVIGVGDVAVRVGDVVWSLKDYKEKDDKEHEALFTCLSLSFHVSSP